MWALHVEHLNGCWFAQGPEDVMKSDSEREECKKQQMCLWWINGIGIILISLENASKMSKKLNLYLGPFLEMHQQTFLGPMKNCPLLS